jgi:hypothetical protein
MPLVDGIKTFAAVHAPDLRREERVMLDKQNLLTFCRDMDLPLFKMEGVIFKDGIVEKKTNLNMLFTRFEGIWVMAYEDVEGEEKDGQ